MNDTRYAELIVRAALHIKEGSILCISATTENLPFAREVARQAYAAGAAEVKVEINDPELSRLSMEHMSEERLQHYGKYHLDEAVDYAEDGACYLSIAGTDPDLLASIDPRRILMRRKTVGQVMKPSMKYTMNDYNAWCVVAYPTVAWARKVFPDLSDQEAYTSLKEAIYKAVRLDRANPEEAWRTHIRELQRQARILNDLELDTLHYTTERGTDFTVGLPEDYIWMGAESTDKSGRQFWPNLPTEEVFTAPDRRRAEGIVYATKPLNLSGSLVRDFWVRFHEGKAVECHAEEGEEHLKNLLSTDEGSSYLGEVALVSVQSPIHQSGLIFMTTLFDENASCHLAFGKAYPTCIKGGEDMREEELARRGINDSQTHCDFMIGDETLTITGKTKSGREVTIFENGEFAL